MYTQILHQYKLKMSLSSAGHTYDTLQLKNKEDFIGILKFLDI